MSGALLLPNAGGGGGTVTSVTAGDASISVGGTPAEPTIETGTLDEIATLHPPAAAVAMNGQKITGQAAGSASTDSANVGQVPALVSGRYLCAPNVYGPATQAVLTTTSATFSAIDSGVICTGSFVAPASGEVIVTVSSMVAKLSAAGQGAFALAAEGTVTPLVASMIEHGLNTTTSPLSLTFPVTGLTPGNSYQFDVLFAVASSLTLTVNAFAQTGTTIGSGSGNVGGPIVVTVQAV
ncbi:MAG TPA: hypothetical protein VN870_09220 [Streptosporangiaceae bacterium]|nr:hypothetical protein [Streptosporangiaceae bacterium]